MAHMVAEVGWFGKRLFLGRCVPREMERNARSMPVALCCALAVCTKVGLGMDFFFRGLSRCSPGGFGSKVYINQCDHQADRYKFLLFSVSSCPWRFSDFFFRILTLAGSARIGRRSRYVEALDCLQWKRLEKLNF